MACGPLTLKNLRDSWGHGPVGEYGVVAVQPIQEPIALTMEPVDHSPDQSQHTVPKGASISGFSS